MMVTFQVNRAARLECEPRDQIFGEDRDGLEARSGDKALESNRTKSSFNTHTILENYRGRNVCKMEENSGRPWSSGKIKSAWNTLRGPAEISSSVAIAHAGRCETFLGAFDLHAPARRRGSAN
jgi:hypothetical protein